jgi:hypothetical protein
MNRTIGGIPLTVWLAALGGIVGISLYVKKKQGSSTTGTAATPAFTQTQEVQDFQIFSSLTGAQQASDLNMVSELAGLFSGGGSSATGSSSGGGTSGGGSGGGGSTGSTSTPTATSTPASAIPSPPSTGAAPPTTVSTGATVLAPGPPVGSVAASNNAAAEQNYVGSVGSNAASLYQAYIATLPAGGTNGAPLTSTQQAALNAYNAAVAANG